MQNKPAKMLETIFCIRIVAVGSHIAIKMNQTYFSSIIPRAELAKDPICIQTFLRRRFHAEHHIIRNEDVFLRTLEYHLAAGRDRYYNACLINLQHIFNKSHYCGDGRFNGHPGWEVPAPVSSLDAHFAGYVGWWWGLGRLSGRVR